MKDEIGREKHLMAYFQTIIYKFYLLYKINVNVSGISLANKNIILCESLMVIDR